MRTLATLIKKYRHAIIKCIVYYNCHSFSFLVNQESIRHDNNRASICTHANF